MFRLRIRNHGVRELNSDSGLGCLLFNYSTSATDSSLSKSHFMVEYLINSLGFSIKEAISASTKVTHLKSTRNPESVVNLFIQCGLDKTQIKNIVSSVPELLLSKPDKTLKPRFKYLQEIGLSGSHLVKVITGNLPLFGRGLETRIKPSIDYLKSLVGSDENVVKAINRSKWLLSSNVQDRIRPNVVLLQKYGFSNDKIEKFVTSNPRHVMQKPEWLDNILRRVEGELGIPRNSTMFLYGVGALASISKSRVEMKYEIFRSFGWSNSDVITMARNLPSSLTLSEAKIRSGLNYLMKELEYTPGYLASHPKFLSLSLEKRVIPRNNVLKILLEKQLLKRKTCLYTLVCYPEVKFVHNFILKYEVELPDLFEIYTKNVGLKWKAH